jgi:hypothetical protein
VIEDMTASAEHQIECFQMQRIGVGQRPVNVDSSAFPDVGGMPAFSRM